MMFNSRRQLVTMTLASAIGCFSPLSMAAKSPFWTKLTIPNDAPAQAIGTYQAGCLAGGKSLPPNGKGYQVMRLTRGRFYGHPDLVDFITGLAGGMAEYNVGTLLVGDLSMARGGPFVSGHRSHQNGLDADLWYNLEKDRPLSLHEREALGAYSLVTANGRTVKPRLWSNNHQQMLKLAASNPKVDRIFVNAAIKKQLCKTKSSADDGWIRKIRPWWGHADHFHVRMKCPADSPQCKSQAPIPKGSGCDKSLDWWFAKHKPAPKKKPSKKPVKPKPKLPYWKQVKLPKACSQIFRAKSKYFH
ncbi:penicillin-insensitive murein endopeptidase [Endozoicomonas sp. SM1973]|uniref:Penicillin-insensitive murein endopeptidase n=1 Tax=Spartinivicinus marinus TaxID=2994442 RepID=A0A853I5V5_9GAMM|nr:penicillin-insensitive murein endopeptidase [Spartinivicinus marinus]MCX4025914.1 penicillin-insensitive murein endopeptidase [Spartinivicinus marinus]NYZ68099.1 penicillin-insensitive murein endopeptidase [Spartinivicinus marinus]